MIERVKIPSPISGGVILSYQCTARCRYCMYACAPEWKDWISEYDLRCILEQLVGKIKPAPQGSEKVSLNYGLHFTGGEPFINFELLLNAVQFASELGIPSTFVETNCFWCTNDDITRERFAELKAKGLKGVLISVNPFYLEFIPFERTERGIGIAQEIFPGNVMVYQWEWYSVFKRSGIRGRVSFESWGMTRNSLQRVEMFLMGRSPYQLRNMYPVYPASSFFNEPCITPFLRSWHNHFDNYGNFLPGYCGGISLGDCRKLDELLREGVHLLDKPVLRFLIVDDFRGLFNYAREYGYEPEEGYVSKCHLCVDIRRFLSSVGEFSELQPREFYRLLE
ncbi:MAG: radical SAM protein [Syntrophales bacterium]|nr:radical SAM protein [Syntrophales bacterium]